MTDPNCAADDMVLVPASAVNLRTNRSTERDRDVYFVQAETLGLIKIGVATDAQERFRSLQAASADRLVILGLLRCSDFGKMERKLHIQFKEHRAHGEWFRPAPELLVWIQHFAETSTKRVRVCQRDIDLWIGGQSRRMTKREMRVRERL